MTKSNTKEISFEKAFQRLEQIVELLEKGEATLEESMQIFEEGMSLVNVCNDKLDAAQTKLKTLIKKDDGSFELDNLE